MSAEETGSGGGPGRADEDAAWRDIVQHYGERISLSSDDLGALDATSESTRADPTEAGPVSFTPAFSPGYDPLEDDPEGFVPPEPPPLPKLPPERLLAWIGVLGAPVAAIVLIVLSFVIHWDAPHWLTALLVVGFLAGFGFLVFTMPKEHDDPWDDGARV